MAIPSQGFKTCGECGHDKPVAEYYHKTVTNKQKKVYKYLSFACKTCDIKRNNAYSDKVRPVMRKVWNERTRNKRAEIKELVFNHYGGWICACCGETERLFLSLDHINNDGADFRRMISGEQHKGGGYHSYIWLLRHDFPAGHQVLCANCQFGKRMNEGVCPHEARRNDYSQVEVGSSDPKRIASPVDEEIVCSAKKFAAA